MIIFSEGEIGPAYEVAPEVWLIADLPTEDGVNFRALRLDSARLS